jgi:hypothetical protein
MSGNGAPILNVVESNVELDPTVRAQTAYASQAVVCTDSIPYDDDIDLAKFMVHLIEQAIVGAEISPHFGGAGGPDVCHHWKGRAVERFTGPFNHTLSNTILVIGNTVRFPFFLGLRERSHYVIGRCESYHKIFFTHCSGSCKAYHSFKAREDKP